MVENDKEIVDIEEYFAAGKSIPKASRFRIRIDKEKYVVDVSEMTGSEILAVAGKDAEKFLLRQKINGAVIPIKSTDLVSFLKPGVERFMTIPNEVTEGELAVARQDFSPLARDVEYLAGMCFRWEAVIENGVRAVIIYDWEVPRGYNVEKADVHVRLNDGYPDSQIDMAYFHPALARADGKAINNLSTLTFLGKEWQQWSRHRTSSSAWRPGIDDLSTHLSLVNDWLERELSK